MPQERRIGENEALFREVNERVHALNETFPLAAVYTSWVCECSSTGCFERVELTPAEYETVRADPARFLIYPEDSHVAPEAELVAERLDRYWVVEKLGQARKIAEALDPRTR